MVCVNLGPFEVSSFERYPLGVPLYTCMCALTYMYIHVHVVLQILLNTNCTFELHSTQPVQRLQDHHMLGMFSGPAPCLKLKGQMLLLPDHNYIAFLASPV